MSDERRGCHAITQAQATARLKLRKSRSMNSGWPNCWTLCWIDSHELPCGSVPPVVAPVLNISSAGLAPNAAADSMPMSATTATAPMMPSARPRWRPERKDPAETNGLEPVESSDDLPLGRIACAVFIWTSL